MCKKVSYIKNMLEPTLSRNHHCTSDAVYADGSLLQTVIHTPVTHLICKLGVGLDIVEMALKQSFAFKVTY